MGGGQAISGGGRCSSSFPLAWDWVDVMAKKIPNPIDVHVGSRVRLRRMLIEMSQEKLGELLGLTFQQVQKYEKGTNRIGASRLYHISQFLGVPVQFFFDDISGDAARVAHIDADTPGFAERTSAPFVMEFVSSAEGLELNRSYARIADVRVRKRILELVRCLAEELPPTDGIPHPVIDGESADDAEEDDLGDEDEDEAPTSRASAD